MAPEELEMLAERLVKDFPERAAELQGSMEYFALVYKIDLNKPVDL